MHNFGEHVCTGCTTIMRAQASIYGDRLNAVLGDAQAHKEYLCDFHVHVEEDGHSLQLEDEDSKEEPGGRTPPPERGRTLVIMLLLCPILLVLLS